jgi:hypothetical protein
MRIGGYTISSAFSRCQLELRLAAILQKRFGHRPKLFILMIMLVRICVFAVYLSRWVVLLADFCLSGWIVSVCVDQ